MAKQQLVDAGTLAQLFGYQDISRIDQLVRSHVITPTMVKENGDSGRMVRRYDLIPVTHEFIQYLRGLAEKKQSGSEDAAAAAEADLRFKQARAEKMELEIKELRGQLHRSEDVSIITADMIAKLRAGIMAIPGQVAVDCAEARTPVETAAIVKAAVDQFLNETAAVKYDAGEYRRLVKERTKWLTEEEIQELTIPLDKPSDSSKDSGKGTKRRKT